MKQLPCVTEKCISYPVCLNKEKVVCDTLYDYYGRYPSYKDKSIWFKINKVLPKLKSVDKRVSDRKGNNNIYYTHTKPLPADWYFRRRAEGKRCYTSRGAF